MSKPWPDIREMLDEAAVQIEPTSFTLNGRALRDLLTDADALLAVATTGKALNLYYEPKLKMWILMGEEAECKAFNQALAALPEHLRG